MTTRETISLTLENIALLLELKGENPFKVRAYRTGSEIVSTYAGDIVQKARDNDLSDTKGIGKALAEKLNELATTGKLAYYDKLRGEFPETIFDLFELTGLGPKKIKALYDKLDITSIDGLKQACQSGDVTKLPGFGAKSCAKILDAIAFRQQHANQFRFGDVAESAKSILTALKNQPSTIEAAIAGSFRRGKEVLHDLDFIVSTEDPEAIMSFFVRMPKVASVSVHGATKSTVLLDSGLQCDLRTVSAQHYPFALSYFTGSREHNIEIRSRALKLGYTLNEYQLTPTGAKEPSTLPRSSIETEEDLYAALSMDFIPPALRENTGEIEAAEKGDLPELVKLKNLQGTFHNHTTASDGKSSLREMAEAANDLGLHYLGISDHSQSSFQANGLDAGQLLAQGEEIKKLNESFSNDFKLLAGVECDILKDGSLDYPDEILGQLDYVVASVHNAFTLPEDEMTARIIRAVENPHITMLGHLTGRLLLTRKPYAVDIAKIIDACAANQTVIEINANPKRLDMDWRWWKHARDKGVKCSINPDAHHVSQLHYLEYGVNIARKGWLTSDDVINCLPLEELEKFLNL
ncbi:MAG: DNA polymerase/3'-5' exonuclease PolX [Verrucomicrobiaceae bacterium]|nr:DNA polymerase/3'-5' exonuclease PolX [Verrucomicrobiaceae bacterium]